jgi:hypothetical protein
LSLFRREYESGTGNAAGIPELETDRTRLLDGRIGHIRNYADAWPGALEMSRLAAVVDSLTASGSALSIA